MEHKYHYFNNNLYNKNKFNININDSEGSENSSNMPAKKNSKWILPTKLISLPIKKRGIHPINAFRINDRVNNKFKLQKGE